MTSPHFKIGDRIRVLQAPPYITEPSETYDIFQNCIGKVLRVEGFDEHGNLELYVNLDGTQAPNCLFDTIWIEPELVELYERVNIMQEIQSRLLEIEQEETATIFYACESGSRAWGFPSEDSDYDVRFLYLRPKNWYLSIETQRDVIERPLHNNLDISGWDLRKALVLLRKSNPPLLEWLNSPIVYLQKTSIADKIREIMPEFYSPVACQHHYYHMAQGNFRDYLKGDIVWVKKYFYLLRPLFAIRWIERETDVVPMEFRVLMDRTITSPALRDAIENLLERKRQGQELDRAPRIPVISDFVESELARLEVELARKKKPQPSVEKLNELFRAALDEVG